jgi:hypothetical protein
MFSLVMYVRLSNRIKNDSPYWMQSEATIPPSKSAPYFAPLKDLIVGPIYEKNSRTWNKLQQKVFWWFLVDSDVENNISKIVKKSHYRKVEKNVAIATILNLSFKIVFSFIFSPIIIVLSQNIRVIIHITHHTISDASLISSTYYVTMATVSP